MFWEVIEHKRGVWYMYIATSFVFYEPETACKTVQDGSRSPQDTTNTLLTLPEDAPRRFQITSASFQYTATDCSVSTYRNHSFLNKVLSEINGFSRMYAAKSLFLQVWNCSKAPQDGSKTPPDASNCFAKHLNRVLRRSRTASGRSTTASNMLQGHVTAQSHLKTLPTRFLGRPRRSKRPTKHFHALRFAL